MSTIITYARYICVCVFCTTDGRAAETAALRSVKMGGAGGAREDAGRDGVAVAP